MTTLGVQIFMGVGDLHEERMYFKKYLDQINSPLKGYMSYKMFTTIKKHFDFPDIALDDKWKYMSTAYLYTYDHHSLKMN